MGVGGLLQSLADSISGLMGSIVSSFQAAAQGAIDSLTGLLPFPWWLIAVGAVLTVVAWFLAKR
jgi:type VI protein secretion system component VasF